MVYGLFSRDPWFPPGRICLGFGNTSANRARLHYDSRMVLIPAGAFWMGSENHFRWERPRHSVWLDEFEIAPYPVTRAEFAEFLADAGEAQPSGWSDTLFDGDNRPVVGVNWFGAVAYCEWFSRQTGQN